MRERAPSHDAAFTIHTQPAPAIVIVILGVAISVPLLTLLGRGPSALAPVLALLVAIWVALALLLARILSITVSILPDRIRYTALPRRRELPYADLATVSLERATVQGYRTSRESTRLRLERASGGAKLVIPLEPFRRADVARIVDALASRAPGARLDPAARALLNIRS